ncbi:retron St85 family RNA-directed DNA polymerase [Undibacterium sp. WLHG33]|uniref:retron St85 family RNA-directed DNA polymerase n=1 Tax=Undibacterium sp. WLHG33 TaxID=3412482 RepID=UPI003C2CBC8B
MSIFSTLADKLLMSEGELLRFALTMPRRYKKYEILKRNGMEMRLIAQPSRESKFIQRMIVDELRNVLRVHKAATAYEKETGIRLNALRHLNSRYLLKMDFKNFFPSITPELFFAVAKSSGVEFEQVDKVFLEHALFFRSTRRARLRMSIGAPSSPFLSNFVMNTFDQAMMEFCVERKISYTRYADDLTFTTNDKNILFDLPKIVAALLTEHCFKKIRINSSKTVFSSKRFNRHVTGIVLTNNNELSIGRERKREIASLINSFRYGALQEDAAMRLKGLIAHAHHIEPNFIARMRQKYSDEVVNAILREQMAGRAL